MLFSERKGYKPIRDVVQKESIDDDLRNGLWNAMHFCIFKEKDNSHYLDTDKFLFALFRSYWHDYFKSPLDQLPKHTLDAYDETRAYFFKCAWYEVYDFIEFTAKKVAERIAHEFTNFCNHVLKRDQSAYRFVENQIVEITAEEEIASIEDALNSSSPFPGVQAHLKSSIQLLSDRKSPDYRNSMKEAISAVESICQELTGDSNATLGGAIKVIEDKKGIHPALKKALSKLYGYTSDADGIRHAMLEETNLTYTDAKFMLVSCTAFINYLIGKISELGINIGETNSR